MRLLIDVQCIQSTSSLRGIGRYALSLTRALVETSGSHAVEVLLNGGDDPARLMRARTALETFLPPSRVHVFDADWPWTPPYDDRRRPIAEAAYAAAVRSLRPDALLVASPFEGDGENVLSIRPTVHCPPTAAVLYDLIPALDPKTYLMGPGASVYWRRFENLQRCQALLAISEHSGRQATRLLAERCPPTTAIWGGAYPSGAFPAFEPQADDRAELLLPDRFLLSVGGDHPRKNLDRLVEAWGQVPAPLRASSPLVIACRLNPGTVRRLRRIARRSTLRPDELILTGGVSETTLQELYRRAVAFVFPSTEEGLGLPPLEAMAAGCPTVLANGSSLSELCEDERAYFDGLDVASIAEAVTRVLSDPDTREALREAAGFAAQRFTWQNSAVLAWSALEQLPQAPRPVVVAPELVRLSSAAQCPSVAARALLLDQPLPVGPAGVLGVPVAPRATLAGAAALVAQDDDGARSAVGAGLLDVPILVRASDLDTVAAHDFYGEFARGLSTMVVPPDLATGVVAAALDPPRWTLQRPRPLWLMLSDDEVEAALRAVASDAGVDLVVAALDGAVLGRSADAVLIAAVDVRAKLDSLSAARRQGARVVAIQQCGSRSVVPTWCDEITLEGRLTCAASWKTQISSAASRWGRTTGWPWADDC